MKAALRQWIEAEHQPWRADPSRSLYRGRIGDSGALPLSRAVRSYYERRGEVAGKFFEDLMEAELFSVLDTVASWLPASKRRKLDRSAAFGLASTHEPDACALAHDGGHAILIDYSFVTVLISSLDMLFGLKLGAGPVNERNVGIALNTMVAAEFFQVVPTEEWLCFRPGPDFPAREQVNSALWFLLVFIVAHEAGHILLGHLDDAPSRPATFGAGPARRKAEVLRPQQRQELEADAFALDLILTGAERGGLFKTSEPQQVAALWQGNYGILAWFFTMLDVVEILSARIERPFPDTHPSGTQRWSAIDATLRRRGLIWPRMQKSVEADRARALEAARNGPLPTIDKTLEDRPDKQAVPFDLVNEVRAMEAAAEAAVKAALGAPDPDTARRMLREHPELLDPRLEALIYEQAVLQSDKNNDELAAYMAMRALPLLQRCREIGVEPAFEEQAAGRLPPPKLPTRVFSMPTEAFREFQRLLEAGDGDRAKQLARQSPDLAATLTIRHTIGQLISARGVPLVQWILHGHPELMHPFADYHFRAIAAAQASDITRSHVELMHHLVARCGEIGMFEAVEEMRQRFAKST